MKLSQMMKLLYEYKNRIIEFKESNVISAELLNLTLRFVHITRGNFQKLVEMYEDDPDIVNKLKMKYSKDIKYLFNKICDFGVMCKRFLLSKLNK